MVTLVRDAPLSVFLVMVALPLVMAAALIVAGLGARKRAATLASTQTTPIGQAGGGYREFEGIVEAVDNRPIRAPLTLEPVCWFHAKVEEFTDRDTDRDRSDWRTVKEATSRTPFLIRDSTGACIVDPDRADVTPTDKSIWYGSSPTPSDRHPARVPPTESAHGLLEIAGGPNSRYRYSEERIYPGDPLLVDGEFSKGRTSAVRDDTDDQATSTDADADEDALWGDPARDEHILARARRVTSAIIRRGSGKKPFMFTTTPKAQHLALTAGGASAALSLAWFPVAVSALLLWVRLH